MSKKKISGTKEWAEYSANLYEGCSNNCRYCYARYNAVTRFHRKTEANWPEMILKKEELHKLWPRRPGRVMFPTAHDITSATRENCAYYLVNNLRNGANVLIVTKPSFDVVRSLCRVLAPFKSRVMWRFTIGGICEDVLAYWEPNAPRFPERLAALAHAFGQGYKTSVSMEPLLEPDLVDTCIGLFYPYVTDHIWIGRMNKIEQRVKVETDEDRKRVEDLDYLQADSELKAIYSRWCDNPKIAWKESIKELVGLPLAERAGEDR